MSIWDSIGDAFEDVADVGKSVAEKIATATVSGANLFASGWKDVFSGDLQNGFKEVGFGMAKFLGIMPPGVTGDSYTEIVGNAALWSWQQYQSSSQLVCFSAYESEVRTNLAKNNIPWSDGMNDPLKAGARKMAWINMDC